MKRMFDIRAKCNKILSTQIVPIFDVVRLIETEDLVVYFKLWKADILSAVWSMVPRTSYHTV